MTRDSSPKSSTIYTSKPSPQHSLGMCKWYFAVCALLVAGCGGESKTVVQGKITYNGNAVTTGLINFQPDKGQPLGGAIQSDGTYKYELPPGSYKVRIDAPGADSGGLKEGEPIPPGGPPKTTPAQRQAPAKYANYDTSGLTAAIGSESPQQLDFPLK
jgi:hypothetical protein